MEKHGSYYCTRFRAYAGFGVQAFRVRGSGLTVSPEPEVPLRGLYSQLSHLRFIFSF